MFVEKRSVVKKGGDMAENICFGAKKGRVGRVNFNLYHYAGNSPVKYTDPDGRASIPFLTPKDFFNFIFSNDSGAKTVKIYADAASGDSAAKSVAKELTKDAGKYVAAESLEAVADAASVVSSISGDLALESVFIQPEAAPVLGTTSEIASGVEVLARTGKFLITNDAVDEKAAKETAMINIGSFIVGRATGKFSNKLPQAASDSISYASSKYYEKNLEKVIDGQED